MKINSNVIVAAFFPLASPTWLQVKRSMLTKGPIRAAVPRMRRSASHPLRTHNRLDLLSPYSDMLIQRQAPRQTRRTQIAEFSEKADGRSKALKSKWLKRSKASELLFRAAKRSRLRLKRTASRKCRISSFGRGE
jgi:hypothetical protein